MVGNEFGLPPATDEIEICLFGPGYGESILLHLGRNDWAIIDSCLSRFKTPAPIEYLKALGLRPSEVVKLVVATHWHDDHVGGLGSIVREAESAKFVCSEALNAEEFLTLVRAYKARAMLTSPGVKEFNDVIDVLNQRSRTKLGIGTPTWAIANRPIWGRSAEGDSP
ncbi:MAG: MBL fold metallo-hydrolase, partial [Nitrospira sp.]|nr:MBL fold metallo-hydrolase [Nitrospira sp.]